MKIKNSFEKQSFMIECLIDIAPEYTNNRYQSIYYRKINNNHVWFELWYNTDDQELKNRYLYASYDNIRYVFYERFNSYWSHFQSFIQRMVLKHTDWGVITPLTWSHN